MIVEFIGESGCGKTTVANKVLSLMPGSRGKNGLSGKDNLVCLMRVLGDKRTRGAYLSLLKLKFAVNKFSRLAKDMLYAAGVYNYLLLDTEESLYIIDQGTVQLLHTIYYNTTIKNDRISSVLEKLFNNNELYVVACRCDRDVLLGRIKKRGEDSQEIPRRIENADKELMAVHEENLNQILSRIPSERCICIDTTGDPDANAHKVSEFIKSRGKAT